LTIRSNSVTEGEIYCLKLPKGQDYGRAGSTLLRQRILHAAEGRRLAHHT
jgi:transposase